MLGDVSGVRNIYIVTGYTDYPRSIVIREDCCEKVHHNNLLTDNSDNDNHRLMRKSGIALPFPFGSVGSGLLANHFSFHSFSFLSTVSWDISA